MKIKVFMSYYFNICLKKDLKKELFNAEIIKQSY